MRSTPRRAASSTTRGRAARWTTGASGRSRTGRCGRRSGRFPGTSGGTNRTRARQLRAFISEQAWWLDDYALYRAAQHLAGGQPWTEWPAAFRDHERAALAAFRRESAQEILFRQYLQWIAHEQWRQARQQSPGLRVSGDFPFGVAADSADVWANQRLFSFDGSVGAPPDAFSEDGQNWQLPVYRWDVMRAERLRVVRAPAPGARRTSSISSASITWSASSGSWIFPRDGRAAALRAARRAGADRPGRGRAAAP